MELKKKIICSAILLALTSTASYATSINLRHEYTPEKDNGGQADRILISHKFENNIGVSVEAKWKTADGKIFLASPTADAGHETSVGYKHKVNDAFTLTPSMSIDSGSSKSTYKFNLKGMYKLSDTMGVGARLRYGYVNTTYETYKQINLYNNYTFSWGKVGIEYEYKDLEDNNAGYKNKGYNDLLSFTGEYSQLKSGWIPFAEVAFVPYDKDGDGYVSDYVPRYRVGVKYNF